MKNMIINANRLSELRMGIVDKQQRLVDCYHAIDDQDSCKGNIYTCTITSIEASLNAVFVDYGAARQGFLPFKEIAACYLDLPTKPTSDESEGADRSQDIASALKLGQKLLVQVEKDERGNKGAALTTFVALSGSYLVMMPFNPDAGGISRQIEGEARDQLKTMLEQLTPTPGAGLIVRTAGVGKTQEELEWDLAAVKAHWAAIEEAAHEQEGARLIHKESSGLIMLVRDYLRPDVESIVVDTQAAFDMISSYLARSRPDFQPNLHLHSNRVPLFTHYQIEEQIESVYDREVTLTSGATLVIDNAEALTAIDINSAKSTKGSDIEETALKTNLEAAEEIARQLRLRDIGGLIVIDFIDMASKAHRDEVENKLASALGRDRARTQVFSISKLGLLEMSRQRLRSSVRDNHMEQCPRCQGRGYTRSVESMASSIIRALEQNAIYEQTPILHVQLPIDVGTYMANEYREHILAIEAEHGVSIFLIPNPSYDIPRYQLKRVRGNKPVRQGQTPSYALKQSTQGDMMPLQGQHRQAGEQPLVGALHHYQKDREPTAERKQSLLKRLWEALFGRKKPAPKRRPSPNRRRSSQRRRSGQQRRRSGNQAKTEQTDSQSSSTASSNPRRGQQRGGQRRRSNQSRRRNNSDRQES